MEIKDSVMVALKELVLPELSQIKQENNDIKIILTQTNKRLDDINIHLADQSRRIDETNKHIDAAQNKLSEKDAEINRRLDRLYEVIVRRDEHDKLERRMVFFEQRLQKIEKRLAA